jgi:spermidine/putrescine ABC transporter ATP-binding subunit
MSGSVHKQITARLDEVTKKFGDNVAVSDIDLEVRQGELLTLLGPSGCGKTTTLRMLAGFEEPTNGTLYIDGEDVTSTPPYHREVGMVFQQYALFPHMTVYDNIAFGLEMEDSPYGQVNERVTEMIEKVRLAGMGDRYPDQLSGGQQQRVALARALAIEPEVLLLDEPLSNLDKQLREEMRSELLRLHESMDVTMVYVTHNQQEALTISDRMAILSDGQIHQVGTPEEVYKYPNNEFVAEFIGDANIFEGKVSANKENRYNVSLCTEDEISLQSSTVVNDKYVKCGMEVTVLLRPEQFKIGVSNENNTLKGTVQKINYIGSKVVCSISIGDRVIQVDKPESGDYKNINVGDDLEVSFNKNEPVVFAEEGV